MELKDYQSASLDTFTRWLDVLKSEYQNAKEDVDYFREKGRDIPDDVLDYPRSAWKKMWTDDGTAKCREYVSRSDEAGRPIPHICFKIPTGGGKTLLAAAAIERLNRQTGLILWVTPTKAIYQQTKDSLRSREHPYRQMLERASGGRVKLLEKDDLFTEADVAHYMCVMLLMLPSVNRQKDKGFLRIFRNSGRYPSFFPDEDVAFADDDLLKTFPDLDRESPGGRVKHSLINVFKMKRPIVVLDEAHKAYGSPSLDTNEEFVRSVNRLNPELVIELSATPNQKISNLLVDITGVELKNEEMIKLPVRITSFTNAEWEYTLAQAHDELKRLDNEAQLLHHSEGRYIRPIAVVRVERTGSNQRDGERVHAEDVRDYLIQNRNVPANSIAVKSSEKDEIGRESLLSEYSPVRWIITKSALMEGWDCPFAYLLVILDNISAQKAITQLVGRVMRQPHAKRTGIKALDQCYVYCWNTNVSEAVKRVKNGLEKEGLTGIGESVWAEGESDLKPITMQRRERYQDTKIFLPIVSHKSGDGWVELDYLRHILPNIDWSSVQGSHLSIPLSRTPERTSASVDVEGTQQPPGTPQELHIDKTIHVSWFARQLSEIVPNAWQAARIAQSFIEALRKDGGTDDEIYDGRSNFAFALRDHVKRFVEETAEKVFRRKLLHGEIRFDLEADRPVYRMRKSYKISVPPDKKLMDRNDGNSVQLSLFKPIFHQQFDSELERNFARYLDEQSALKWWHRIAVNQGGYYLRGWKQERIWPDFVAMGDETKGYSQFLIFETKGQHLSGNQDTEYKKCVLETLEGAFNCGTMTLNDGPEKGTFRLVFNEHSFPPLQGEQK